MTPEAFDMSNSPSTPATKRKGVARPITRAPAASSALGKPPKGYVWAEEDNAEPTGPATPSGSEVVVGSRRHVATPVEEGGNAAEGEQATSGEEVDDEGPRKRRKLAKEPTPTPTLTSKRAKGE